MIIGLTGKNGSGKGEAARFLMDAGYQYFSLSDEVRTELESRGEEVTRDSLTVTANELREKLGAGVLAERTLEKLDPTAHAIVDSVRNPFEVETLRRRDGFYLINVDSDTKIRFERVKNAPERRTPPPMSSSWRWRRARHSRTTPRRSSSTARARWPMRS